MRKFILCILSLTLFFTFSTSAQTHGFSVSDTGTIYWQRVYPIELTHDELMEIITNDGRFVDINDGDVITFYLKRTPVDFKDLGYSRMDIPLYAAACDASCFVTIQQKEDKYRVTADNIILIENQTTRMFKEGEENHIEKWAVKAGKIANGFSESASSLYNAFFTKMFFFQKKSYIDNEW